MMVRYFRKKPITIEAILWDGSDSTYQEIVEWAGEYKIELNDILRDLQIHTMEGIMTAKIGDWLIKGMQGEIYCCKGEIFKEIYEEVK